MKHWIDPKISWKGWKLLVKQFKTGGIESINGDRMLWEMLRDRKLNIYLDSKEPDDPFCITLKSPPKKYKVIRDKSETPIK